MRGQVLERPGVHLALEAHHVLGRVPEVDPAPRIEFGLVALVEAHLGLGVDAIWWSFPVSAAVATGLTLAYYRWGRWKEARMLPADPDEMAIPSEVPAMPPSPVADAAVHVAPPLEPTDR